MINIYNHYPTKGWTIQKIKMFNLNHAELSTNFFISRITKFSNIHWPFDIVRSSVLTPGFSGDWRRNKKVVFKSIIK